MSGLSGLSDEIDEALGTELTAVGDGESESRDARSASSALCPAELAAVQAPVQQSAVVLKATGRGDAAVCLHTTMFGNLCAVCGSIVQPGTSLEPAALDRDQHELHVFRAASTKAKRKAGAVPLAEHAAQPPSAVSKLMNLTYMGDIRISADDAARVSQRTKKALVDSKKLMLVLDLDHTLLNSKADVRLEDQDRSVLKEMQSRELSEDEQAGGNSRRMLFHLPHRGLWTKLRPGVHELLTELDALYDLHVYTMGDRVYAHDMASLLDRSGQKFKHKLISRNDSLNERQKDLRLLLGAEDMVLIVDDTASVWAECSQNIMQVERYHYFPPSPERNAAPSTSLLRQRCDEPAGEGQLRQIADVLKEVHRRFYLDGSSEGEASPRDARAILAELRKEILHGCVIVFSKVISLAQQRQDVSHHPLWVMATRLGARCTTSVDSETTHVVALSTHTDKVQQALRRGLHAVHPSWLTACFYQWRKVDESLHPAPEEEDGVQFMRSLHLADLAAIAAAGGGQRRARATLSRSMCKP